jgi:hypothetical protein
MCIKISKISITRPYKIYQNCGFGYKIYVPSGNPGHNTKFSSEKSDQPSNNFSIFQLRSLFFHLLTQIKTITSSYEPAIFWSWADAMTNWHTGSIFLILVCKMDIYLDCALNKTVLVQSFLSWHLKKTCVPSSRFF